MSMDAWEIKNQIRDYWTFRASEYDNDPGHGLKSEAEKKAWMDLFVSITKGEKPLQVLDVATGTGFLALLLSEMGHVCTGIDLSPGMLEQARRKAAPLDKEIVFLQGDAENLPLADESFDLVINRHLLWTLPHPSIALQEWFRVCRPGGKVIVIDGTWGPMNWEDKVRRFVGRCLVALTEVRNPWASAYSRELQSNLPLMGGGKKEDVVKRFHEQGFSQVSVFSMDPIVNAQLQQMPLSYRLTHSRKRYVVVGQK